MGAGCSGDCHRSARTRALRVWEPAELGTLQHAPAVSWTAQAETGLSESALHLDGWGWEDHKRCT